MNASLNSKQLIWQYLYKYQLPQFQRIMYHTINLNINESWNNKKLTTVNNHISLNALIKKHLFRIEDFAISNPKIILYYLMMTKHGTVTKADQLMTFCWHPLLLYGSQFNKVTVVSMLSKFLQYCTITYSAILITYTH